MQDAVGHRVQNSLPLTGPANEVKRVERDDNALERLLEILIAREFPDLAAKREMAFKKPVQVLRFSCGLGSIGKTGQFLHLLDRHPWPRERHRQRFQDASQFEDLLRVFRG